MQQAMPGTPPWERPLASLPQRFFGQLIDGAVALGLAVGVVVLTPLDNIVAPQDSPVMHGAANVELRGIGHLSLLCSRPVFAALLVCLL